MSDEKEAPGFAELANLHGPKETKPELNQAQREIAAIRNAENTLLRKSMQAVEDAMDFREIDPSQKEPPQEWVDEHGLIEAQKRFRIAQAAWLGSKNAPVGLKMAQALTVGIIRAKATERAAPMTLNAVQVVVSASEKREYPETEIIDTEAEILE